MKWFKISKPKTYYITITEMLKKKVEVEANSEEEAMNKVKKAYEKMDITLDEYDFTAVKFKFSKR